MQKKILRHSFFLVAILLFSSTLFAQNSLPAIPGLAVWFRADSGVTVSGNNVVQINDLSGNGRHAYQNDPLLQPLLINNRLNGNPVFRFDGSNDFIGTFDFAVPLAQANTYFFVWRISGSNVANGNQVLISGASGFTNTIAYTTTAPTRLNIIAGRTIGYNKTIPFRHQITTALFNTTASNIRENGVSQPLFNGTTTTPSTDVGTLSLSKLIIGSLYGTGNFLNAEVAEVLVYNANLTTTQRFQVEQYLRLRYARQVNLGPDLVLADSFCHTLSIGSGFSGIVWRNAGGILGNAPTLNITKPDKYWVSATDSFGYQSIDTINISYGFTGLNSTNKQICLGDTFKAFPVFSVPNNLPFNYLWSNGSTNDTLKITQQGNYVLRLQDHKGCQVFSDTLKVVVDTFQKRNLLPDNASLCSGSTLSPNAQPSELLSTQWSNGNTSFQATISTGGFLKLTATNLNSCIAVDSVFITISGSAPSSEFSADTVCLKATTSFLNQSTPAGTIVSSVWKFGDGDSSLLFSPNHKFLSAGVFQVTLTNATQNGCASSITKAVLVRPAINAMFSIADACVGLPVIISESSNATLPDAINKWTWDFGDGNFATLQNPSHTYNLQGSFQVMLAIESDLKCKDTLVKTVNASVNTPPPSQAALAQPSQGFVTGDSVVTFQWSLASNAVMYRVEVSTSSSFQTLLKDTLVIGNSVTLSLGYGVFYWRVQSLSACLSPSTSSSNSFTVFNPKTFGNLIFWGDAANTVVDSSGRVQTLLDRSGNNYHANQSNTLLQPKKVDNTIFCNQKPVLRFDGIDDFLETIDFSPPLSQANTFFFVWRINGANNASGNQVLLSGASGSTNSIAYTTSSPNRITMIAGSTIGYNKTIPFNHQITTALFNTTTSNVRENGVSQSLFSGTTNTASTNVGTLSMSKLNLGNLYGTGNNMNGEVAEVLFYNSNLTTTQRAEVEQYLRFKYARQVNLGPDVTINDKLCHNLSAGACLSNIVWRNQAGTQIGTGQNVTVNRTGIYTVSAIDAFGYTTRDTIQVAFTFIGLNSANKTICLGDTLKVYPVFSQSVPSGYTYLWNTGNTSDTLSIEQNGNYRLEIKDNISNCSVFSDTLKIAVDSFRNRNLLPTDTALCAGSDLQPFVLQSELKNVLWSNGDTLITTQVQVAGYLAVTLTNTNDCVANDSVLITALTGVVPITDFNADTVCLGNPTTFTNVSDAISPDSIISQIWRFSVSDSSTIENPVYQFTQAGIYAVTLTNVTRDGCIKTIVKNVTIHPAADADFSVANACVNIPIIISQNSSAVAPDVLNQWTWYFGNGDSSMLPLPVYSYAINGDYNIQLKVKSSFGCVDSLTKQVSVVFSSPMPDTPQLIAPIDNMIVANGSVNFSWATTLNAALYKVQISQFPNFSVLLIDTLTQFNSIQLQLLSAATYYWRVVALNPCLQPVNSVSRVISLISLSTAGTMVFWGDAANTTVDANSKVSLMSNLAGNGFNALQLDTAYQPRRVENILNGKPVLRFDGKDDFLSTNDFVVPLQQPNTIFAVWRISGATSVNQTLVSGGSSTTGNNIAHTSTSTPNRINMIAGSNIGYNKTIPFSHQITSAAFNTANSTISENGTQRQMFSGSGNTASSNSGSNPLSKLNVGNLYGTGNHLNGEVAELIVFNSAVGIVSKTEIEQYLRFKYAPQINLGPDIKIPYGVCDTSLDIGPNFTNILWSTGATTRKVNIEKPGKYWVTALDIFGYTTSDTINVFVPYSGISPATDTIICEGTLAKLDYNIVGAPYSFLWSTGDTTKTIFTSLAGAYSLQVSDTLGCVLQSDTINVIVDSLQFFSVLDNDTVACTNAPLGLIPYIYPYQTYQWSTGSTKDTILVAATGIVYVTVTDVNGCATNDSINISRLKGIAPIVDFGFKNVCLGDTTLFSDSTQITAPEALAIRKWTFGIFDTSSLQNPGIVFPNSAIYPVTLYVETDSGCFASKTKDVQLGARPSPFISYNVNCANTPVILTDASTIPIGDTIKFWNWNINNGNIFTTKNVTYNFPSIGEYPVKLIVTSAKGCVDSTSVKVEVFPPINPDFTYTNQCVGQTTVITDVTPSLSIIKRIWRLSDQVALINDSLSFRKVFAAADTFQVTLEVTNAIGCIDTITKSVVIYPNPVAQITDTVACKGASVTLTENTQSDDSIVRYDWIFDGKLSKQRNPTFVVNDTGLVAMQLKVTSLQGCIDSVQRNFRVLGLPKASFAYSPLFGESPLEVTFTNTSTNAAGYTWNFGDGTGVSTDKNPVYTYTFNDTFTIKLTAANQLGCADSVTRDIVVIPTDADIQLLTINTQNKQLSNGALSTQVLARFANVGTQPIINAQFLARLDDGTTILDDWQGILYPGDQLLHTFSSSFYLPKSSVVQYVCVDAMDVNNGAEKRLDNNKNCRSLTNQSVVTNLYPNPASGQIFLDLILPEETDFSFEVSNEMGQKMIPQFDFKGTRGINTVPFDVRAFRPGMYFLRIKYKDSSEVQKFQVIR